MANDPDANLRTQWSSTPAAAATRSAPRVRPMPLERTRQDQKPKTPIPVIKSARLSTFLIVLFGLVAPMVFGALVGIVGSFALGPKGAIVRGILFFAAGFGAAVSLVPIRRHNAISRSFYEISSVAVTLLVVVAAFVARVMVWDPALDPWDAVAGVVQIGMTFAGMSKGRRLTYDETLDA